MMEISFILLCVIFSEHHFAHIHDMFVFDNMLYAVCVVSHADAACVVPTVTVVTLDSCMII
jgi:hypothetical protein